MTNNNTSNELSGVYYSKYSTDEGMPVVSVVGGEDSEAAKLIHSLLKPPAGYTFIGVLNLLPKQMTAAQFVGISVGSRNTKVSGDDFEAVPFILRATTEYGGNISKCPPKFVRAFLNESVTKTINGEERTWENIPRTAIDSGLLAIFSQGANGELLCDSDRMFEKEGYDPNRPKKGEKGYVDVPVWNINHSTYSLTECQEGVGYSHVREARLALAAQCKAVFAEGYFELHALSLVASVDVETNDKGDLINIRAPYTLVYGKPLAKGVNTVQLRDTVNKLKGLARTHVSPNRVAELAARFANTPVMQEYKLQLEGVVVPRGVVASSASVSAPPTGSPTTTGNAVPAGNTTPIASTSNANAALNALANGGASAIGNAGSATALFSAKLGAKPVAPVAPVTPVVPATPATPATSVAPSSSEASLLANLASFKASTLVKPVVASSEPSMGVSMGAEPELPEEIQLSEEQFNDPASSLLGFS